MPDLIHGTTDESQKKGRGIQVVEETSGPNKGAHGPGRGIVIVEDVNQREIENRLTKSMPFNALSYEDRQKLREHVLEHAKKEGLIELAEIDLATKNPKLFLQKLNESAGKK